jgi:hypothetical protein
MPDRSYAAIDALIRRVQRVVDSRSDPTRILAEVIGVISASGADPCTVLGVLVEGAAHTLVHHIPKDRRADTAATLFQLLEERLKAHGVNL